MMFTWVLNVIFVENKGMGIDEQMEKGDEEREKKSNCLMDVKVDPIVYWQYIIEIGEQV